MVLTREHVKNTLRMHGYAVPGENRMAKLIAVSEKHPELPEASQHWLNEGQRMLIFRHAAEHGADAVREALEAGHHPGDPGFAVAAKKKQLSIDARAAKARDVG